MLKIGRYIETTMNPTTAPMKTISNGSTKRQVRRSYPGASFRHSTEDVFGITLVNVPRGDGGKLQMGISVDTKRVIVFAVPHLAFCE